jgi:hypothetical protein
VSNLIAQKINLEQCAFCTGIATIRLYNSELLKTHPEKPDIRICDSCSKILVKLLTERGSA